MLSLQEISDRLEIQQLLVDYSTAIDQRRFDDLDAVRDAVVRDTFGALTGRLADLVRSEWT